MKGVVKDVAADIFQRWFDMLIVSGRANKCAQYAPEQTTAHSMTALVSSDGRTGTAVHVHCTRLCDGCNEYRERLRQARRAVASGQQWAVADLNRDCTRLCDGCNEYRERLRAGFSKHGLGLTTRLTPGIPIVNSRRVFPRQNPRINYLVNSPS